MLSKRLLLNKLALLVLFTIIISGCEGPQGPAGPVGTQPIWIEGYVSASDQSPLAGSVIIGIQNCPTIPSVRVNNVPILYNGFGFF